MANVDYDNLNTPKIEIASPIENTQGLGAVDVSQVGYSYSEEGGFAEMSKSLKDKLDEIDEALADTSTIETKVQEAVSNLNIPETSDIESAVLRASGFANEASGYVNSARNYSEASSTSSNNALAAFNKIHYGYFVDSLKNVVAVPGSDGTFTGIGIYSGQTPIRVSVDSDEWKLKEAMSENRISCYFVKSLNSYTEEFNKILEVSDAFATGFDADAQFAIVSESTYNDPLFTKVDNTIYFIY